MSALDEVLAHKREEVADAKKRRPLAQLEQSLKGRPPLRSFRQAIRRPGKLSLIAEVKRASPSAGWIKEGASAAGTAQVYAAAGAQAVSVLTDRKFFAGSIADLVAVKGKVELPVLRKDFLLEEYQLVEAAAAGADAVLLIVAALKPEELKRLLKLAGDLSLDALVETHDEQELDQALEAGAQVVGINNRNLATLKVDLETTKRLAAQVPPDRVLVSESGIRSRADVEKVAGWGAHAVLVGEELMSAPDPGARIKELMGDSDVIPPKGGI